MQCTDTGSPSSEVRVHVHSRELWLLPCSVRELAAFLSTMLNAANELRYGEPIYATDIYLVDDAEIAAANLKLMHAPGPTNILSLPGDLELPAVLILSLDTFARECFFYGQRPKDHLLTLLAHGTAHLAHLDHGIAHSALQEHVRQAALSSQQ